MMRHLGSNFSRMIGVLFLCLIGGGGCGDFFSEKPTEIQSQNILDELSRIETVPDPNVQLPAIYKKPPEIMDTVKGVKLFYFAKYHTVETLSSVIKDQLGYKVTANSPINQIIVECPTRDEAVKVLEFIDEVDVPLVQVRIDCMVSELYSDVTMDWETTLKIENLFGENVTLGGKEDSSGNLLPAFPGASLRESSRDKIGLKVGYTQNLGVDGHEFRALVDLLVSRGYLKILMNPSLEVVNGQKAMIQAREYVPLPKEVTPKDGEPYLTTEYQWVTDSLEITPRVFADGYISLETKVTLGSKSTPEGVKQVSIITDRTIENAENRIRQGQSLIIGGLRKVEKRSVVRGVPFLKDIPLLGVLFSSKDFEERAKEVLFILTPTISNYGVPNEKMVELLKKKHEPPVPEEVHNAVMNSLGLGPMNEFFGRPNEQQAVPDHVESPMTTPQRGVGTAAPAGPVGADTPSEPQEGQATAEPAPPSDAVRAVEPNTG